MRIPHSNYTYMTNRKISQLTKLPHDEFWKIRFSIIIPIVLGAPDCGGIYTGESGEIISPGYHSGAYRPNMICDWEIRLPDTNSIRIKWLNFDVERSRNCMFDSVQVYSEKNILNHSRIFNFIQLRIDINIVKAWKLPDESITIPSLLGRFSKGPRWYYKLMNTDIHYIVIL